MKHIFKISALLATLTCVSAQKAEECANLTSCNVQEMEQEMENACVAFYDEMVNTLRSFSMEIVGVDENGRVYASMPAAVCTAKGLVEGAMIGTIGGLSYIVESIEQSEDAENCAVILSVAGLE